MFQVRVAVRHRLIQSTLGGFLSVGEVREYAGHMEAAHSRWFRFNASYRLVIDAGAAKIQTQEVLAAFAAHIAIYPPAERIGVICGPSLSRVQALRLLDRPYVRLCEELGDAQGWTVAGSPIPEDEFELVASSDAG